MQEASSPPAHSPQEVGYAFVEQYYHLLHTSPGLVHRFYQDSSLLSRPDPDGVMKTVTTTEGIDEKIISLNYEEYTSEISTADAQESLGKGVIVLVTGFLTGKDNMKKKFSQTFFLARQEVGYFVLNDVFRFVGENSTWPDSVVLVNGVKEDSPPAVSSPVNAWDNHVSEDVQPDDKVITVPVSSTNQIEPHNGDEATSASDKEGSVAEEESAVTSIDSNQKEILTAADTAPAVTENAPKKSYASIVKTMAEAKAYRPIHAPTNNLNVTPSKDAQHQSPMGVRPASFSPETQVPINGASGPESAGFQEEVEGYSIYVRNLPFNATEEQLDDAFRKFGPIKHDGIQIRSNKQGFCFGFVEFETLSSMQSALQASPMIIGNREAVVEEKRTNTRGGTGRGRYFSSGRNAYRSDSFRGRGGFNGGRGYARGEFRNQGVPPVRARPSFSRDGEDFQWVSRPGNRRNGRFDGGGRGGPAAPEFR